MYTNLKSEMENKKIKRKDLAEFLGIRQATLCDKINGKYPFKLEEAFKIKYRYFPESTIEYLFEGSVENE